jgi:hypothetical protein
MNDQNRRKLFFGMPCWLIKEPSIGVLSKLLTLNGSAILNLEVSIAVGAELVSCCICFDQGNKFLGV